MLTQEQLDTMYCSECGAVAKDIELYIHSIRIEQWVFRGYRENTNTALYGYRKDVNSYESDRVPEAQCQKCQHIWNVDLDSHNYDLV